MLHVGFISGLLCQKRWTDICPVNLDQHSTRSCLHMYCTKTNWYVSVILQMQIWACYKIGMKIRNYQPLSSINGNLNAVVLVFSTSLGIIYTIQKTCMLWRRKYDRFKEYLLSVLSVRWMSRIRYFGISYLQYEQIHYLIIILLIDYL